MKMRFNKKPTIVLFKLTSAFSMDVFNWFIICYIWGKIYIVPFFYLNHGFEWMSEYFTPFTSKRKNKYERNPQNYFNYSLHVDMDFIYPVNGESTPSFFDLASRQSATFSDLMHYEWARFLSFSCLQSSSSSSSPSSSSSSFIRLAQAGFYFDKTENKIKCFACGVHHDGCLTSASQIELHREMSPQCPFVLGTGTSNISIQSTESENDTAQSVPNETGIPVEEGQPNRNPSSMEENNISNQPSTETSISTNTTNSVINQSYDNVHPRMPAYSSITSRLMTFKNWPKHVYHSPESLAEAGFFYTGEGDTVRCFYCDGGLRNWEDDDVPWIEHARHFPKCKFLHENIGMTGMHRVRNIEVSMHDLMSRPAAESVRFVGYSNALIQRAYTLLMRSRDPWEITAEDLLDSIFILEDMEQESKAKDEEISRLREENDHLRDKVICKICFDQKASIVFLPCGHMCCCTDCSIRFSTRCPICRANIKGKVKIYLS